MVGGTTQETEETQVVRRAPGKNLPEMLANLTKQDTETSIIELIANSYDADATQVHLQYNEENDLLVVEDNGLGMTPTELENAFYKLGDSPKLEEKYTPELNRRKLGDRGIGTILIKALSDAYKLTTRKDGLESIVEEEFNEDMLRTGKEIEIQTQPTSEESGTQIEMTRLRFGPDTGFKLKELRRRIRWELPILPDFEVYVNGEKVQSKSIEKATEFEFDRTGNEMGHVHGSLYYANSPADMRGIHVYVHGRRVGDPKKMLEDVPKTDRARIIGILHADDLEEAIAFDRSQFQPDHPGVQEFRAELRSSMQRVRKYAKTRKKVRKTQKFQSQKSDVPKQAQKKLRGSPIDEVHMQTEIRYDENLEQNSTFNHDEDTIIINPHHPSLQHMSGFRKSHYEMQVLNMAARAIAQHRLENPTPSELEQETNKIWQAIKEKKEANTQEKMPLFPNVKYTSGDLASKTGKKRGTLNYLIRTGMLESDENDKVTGHEFQRVQEQTTGMPSLHHALGQHPEIEDETLFRKTKQVANVLSKQNNSYKPFVRNLHTPKRPCYFIEGTCSLEVTNFILSDNFDGRRISQTEENWKHFRTRHYTLPDMKDRLGLSTEQAIEIVDYSDNHGININTMLDGGMKFHYGDFINALQHYRGNI